MSSLQEYKRRGALTRMGKEDELPVDEVVVGDAVYVIVNVDSCSGVGRREEKSKV